MESHNLKELKGISQIRKQNVIYFNSQIYVKPKSNISFEHKNNIFSNDFTLMHP